MSFKRHWLALLLLLLGFSVQAESVKEGQLAPALNLPLLGARADESMSLEALRGKVVYLDFWASWCGPCRLSFPQLEALRQELGPRGFEVLAVNVDEFEDDALAFLDAIPVTYPVVRDADADSPARYGILGMPTGFLLDREGVVKRVHQGYRRSDGEKLRKEIVQLLESTE
ncbi:MAG: TlpA disulfide reductase family protein [Halioglobus sp.]|jgi:thiol-disulfide isomerase/thioredoxin|nr:TlpA disulfide reductase family protein [Halioglobus sp.]MDG2327849.1 TlpA disulfide reductase family protein [Halioglobus sp.]